MIETLTPEQEALIPVLFDEGLKKGLATGRCDRPLVEEACALAYSRGGLPMPTQFYWCDGPKAGLLKAAQLLHGREETTQDERRAVLSYAFWGQHDAPWATFYKFCGMCGEDTSSQDGIYAMLECGWWWAFDEAVVLCDRPESLTFDDAGRLHNETGPAVRYFDGFEVYAWHGVQLARELIMEPVTLEQIQKETNAEINRILIERFGMERYLEEMHAEVIDESQWGTLLRLPRKNDVPLLAVKVLNSTPEPDGSIKTYVLQVDPECRPIREGRPAGQPQKLTALNAVASTFFLTGEEYARIERQT